MTQSLQEIFELEDNENFYEAFEAYRSLYSKDKSVYDVWKHFYVFLWISIEDAPSSFHDKVNLRHLLQVMLDEGKERFGEKADFNFIAGYTVSIFPNEYGNYNDLEKEGHQMLLKATQLDPDNKIYNMAYLGSFTTRNNKKYRQSEIEAASKVLETFSGKGALNRYFKEIFYRLDKKAHR